MKLSKPLETLLTEWEPKDQQKDAPILSPLLVENTSQSEIPVGGEGIETKVVVSYLRQKKGKDKG